MTTISAFADQIKAVLDQSRRVAAKQVNDTIIQTYWEIGRLIVEGEQAGALRAEYGTGLLAALSKELSSRMEKGFSRSNLANMRLFYQKYPIVQSVTGQLSWTHYVALLSIDNDQERSFYEHEANNARWSVRDMKRQIESNLYHRVLLSGGKVNQEKVMALAKEGIALNRPESVLRSPYVFEFLGMPENKPMLERDLEAKLIRQIEDFMLELGRGFMFVGSQYRITMGSIDYYVDMVFYNKALKAYVLIDLKMGEFRAEFGGQMNMYLNYFQKEINEASDNPPIGIILCRSGNDIMTEYALGGLSSQIFASKYMFVLPDREELESRVERLLAESDNDMPDERHEKGAYT